MKYKYEVLYLTTIHSNNKSQYYFIYYLATGKDISNNTSVFITYHVQTITDVVAAVSVGNPLSYILVVANLKVNRPKWKCSNYV